MTNARNNLCAIDEVKKIPALLDTIHQIIFKKKQKFALTGSSARKLKRVAQIFWRVEPSYIICIP